MHIPTRGAAAALAVLAALASCASAPGPLGLDGRPAHVPTCGASDVQVFVFTSHECPIANAYAPTLRELAAAWSGQPVSLWLVHVDPDLTPAAAAAHARDYELPGTVLLDPHHLLVRRLGASRTPEAVVCDQGGVTYRGRIDDQWAALGSRAREATSPDLRLAVAATLAGRAVPEPHPPAVGCLLPEPR